MDNCSKIIDLYFYAILFSMIFLCIGLYFRVFELVIFMGFLLASLLAILIGFAFKDLGWLPDKPIQTQVPVQRPKQIVNIFPDEMRHPTARPVYGAVPDLEDSHKIDKMTISEELEHSNRFTIPIVEEEEVDNEVDDDEDEEDEDEDEEETPKKKPGWAFENLDIIDNYGFFDR